MDPRYPFEAIRGQYVTLFGGTSTDLYPGEVGLRGDAIRARTHLVPFQDRVLVAAQLGGQRVPLFARETYRVVALDDSTPDALALGEDGAAVFSSFEDPTVPQRSLALLRARQPIVMNATMTRFEDEARSLVERFLRRESGS